MNNDPNTNTNDSDQPFDTTGSLSNDVGDNGNTNSPSLSSQTPTDVSVLSPDTPIPPSNEQFPQTTVTATDGQLGGDPPTGPSSKKFLATILGLVLLVAGVGTGVYLVGQQQRISTRALQCSGYVFEVTRSGEVSVRNGTTQAQVAQQAQVYINNQLLQTLSVPALQPGQSVTLGSVTVPDTNIFTWRVTGAVDCQTSGEYPSSQSSTSCSEVVAYDTQWNILSASDLSSLSAGDTVRFAVTGTTSEGTFEAAKFTINGVEQPETSLKKDQSTYEFYMDYEIPANVNNFEVKAMIKHSALGWF